MKNCPFGNVECEMSEKCRDREQRVNEDAIKTEIVREPARCGWKVGANSGSLANLLLRRNTPPTFSSKTTRK